jgi:hypothetical protein
MSEEGWAEARCWVLRDRAESLRILVWFLQAASPSSDRWGVWLGPALTKLLVVVTLEGVFSL